MDPVTNTQNSLATSLSAITNSSGSQKQLNQQDFLKLMMTQLSMQNPLEPQDSGMILQQMTQLSTLSSNESMQKTLQAIASAFTGNQSLQASSLVGKNVQIASSTAALKEGEGLSGGVLSSQGAKEVTVQIKDASGKVVKTLNLGDGEKGLLNFKWDGIGDDGKAAAAGTYTISATASINGEIVALSTAASAKVSSVTLGQNGSSVLLNLEGIGSIDLNKVLQIQ